MEKIKKCLFLVFLLTFCIETCVYSVVPSDQTLSPPIQQLQNEAVDLSLTVTAICRYIEEKGLTDNSGYLDDVYDRVNRAGQNAGFCMTVRPYEVVIEVPREHMAIRYYDPAKAPTITPYSDVRDLYTKVVNHRLCRQVIHRRKALIYFHSPYFNEMDKGHMSELIQFTEAEIKAHGFDSEFPIAARIVDRTGRVVVTSMGRAKTSDKYGARIIHAEIEAIREAEISGFSDWEHATMYITMNSSLLSPRKLADSFGIRRIVYGSIRQNFNMDIRRDIERCRNEGVEIIECDDSSLLEELEYFPERTETDRIDDPSFPGLPLFDWALQHPGMRLYPAHMSAPLEKYNFKIKDGEAEKRGRPVINRMAEEFRGAYKKIFDEDVKVFLMYVVSNDIFPGYSMRQLMEKDSDKPARDLLVLVGDRTECLRIKKLILTEAEVAKAFSEGYYKDEEILIFTPGMIPLVMTVSPILDMHIHSSYSDGELSPEEIIEEARKAGLESISITDHNTMDAYTKDPEVFDKAKKSGIKLIAGAEISSYCRNECFNDGCWFTDVIGMFPRQANESQDEYLARIERINSLISPTRNIFKKCVIYAFLKFREEHPQAGLSFKELLERSIEGDEKNGFFVDRDSFEWEKVENEEYWREGVRDEAFLASLPRNFSESAVTTKYLFEKIGEINGLPEGVKTPYDVDMHIMANKDHYFGEPGPDTWQMLDIGEVYRLIRDNKGYPVLAHPSGQRLAMGSEVFEKWLEEQKEMGLHGIEAFSRGHSAAEALYFTGLAIRLGLIMTNGSDFHGPNVLPGRKLATGYDDSPGNLTTPEMIEQVDKDMEHLRDNVKGPWLSQRQLFSRRQLEDLRTLLDHFPEHTFPQGPDFRALGDEDETMTLREVIEKTPSPDYKVPQFNERYTRSVYDEQYKISRAEWKGSGVKMEDVIVELFPHEAESVIEIYRAKEKSDRKAAKAYLMEKLWNERGAVDGFEEMTLFEHAEREYEVINRLISGDLGFGDSLANQYLSPEDIEEMYKKFFGDEFKELNTKRSALNFMDHLLLLHGLGKYSIGEKWHERRTEAILGDIFKHDYCGFPQPKKNLLMRVAGFHHHLEYITSDDHHKERFLDLIEKTVSEGYFTEEELLDILKVWIVLRIAERVESEYFGFLEGWHFENYRDVYDMGKQLIREKYAARDENPVRRYSYYLNENGEGAGDLIGKGKPDVLLRVPVEGIDTLDAGDVRTLLDGFQKSPNAYVELFYASGIGEAAPGVYEKYGLMKKKLPKGFKSTRLNTLTLLPAFRGEVLTASAVTSRLGSIGITPKDTVIVPVGVQNDPIGLARSTVAGLKIMGFARELAENDELVLDQGFRDRLQRDMMEVFKEVCDPDDREHLAGLTVEDIIALVSGESINDILKSLRKFVKLLPIMPIDPAEQSQIYETTRRVLLAA